MTQACLRMTFIVQCVITYTLCALHYYCVTAQRYKIMQRYGYNI